MYMCVYICPVIYLQMNVMVNRYQSDNKPEA